MNSKKAKLLRRYSRKTGIPGEIVVKAYKAMDCTKRAMIKKVVAKK